MKFDTKYDRNLHCTDHGMPEKCVPLGDEKPPKPAIGPNHISGVYCEDPKECQICKNNPWMKKKLSKPAPSHIPGVNCEEPNNSQFCKNNLGLKMVVPEIGPNHIPGTYCDDPNECLTCKNDPGLKTALSNEKKRKLAG